MKVQLFHRQEFHNGMQFTLLAHVKVLTPDGRHLSFARITPELLEFIRGMELDVPDPLLNWKGKAACSPELPKNI